MGTTTSSLTNCQNFNNNNNEDEATTLPSPFGLFSMGCTNMDEIELNSNNKCSTEKIAGITFYYIIITLLYYIEVFSCGDYRKRTSES